MKRLRMPAAAAVALAVTLTGCQSGGSTDAAGEGGQSSAAALEGKTIELIVPFDPGGGYDQYARALSGPLGEELGAEVIVVNKPGAGGLLANNDVFKAEPDGLTLEILNMTGTLGSALAGAEGVQYDPADFSYVGRMNSEPAIVVVSPDGKYSSFDDLIELGNSSEVRFSATGPGSNEYIDPTVLTSILGLNSKIITGFGGSGEAALALTQGNVDAYSRALSSQLPLIQGGEATPVLVLGSERVKEFKDVPTALELDLDDEQMALMESHVSLIESGRTIAAPPGMDADLLEVLRSAFTKVVQDPTFMSESEAAGRPIIYSSGEDVQEQVSDLMDAPKAYVDILKKGFSG
jgi:tripartite-type tricarboxylate transporter receptor subunit TctC